jgi:tetratricopeptide (TPR) repeat protein
MNRYLEEHPPTDDDGFEAISRLFSGRSLDDPLTQPRSPGEQAQDLCFRAFDTHGRRRVQLARQALQLDADCTDAHVILAEQAGTLEDEFDHYRRGMQAAERKLGSAFFAENVGHFWGISETRPYMRARFGLAESLVAAGREDEGIAHYQELLRLNPSDNQGVRYVLLPKLLAAGRDVEAARLLKESDEESANWVYARALLAFRLSGRSAAADRELRDALRTNPHVPELLCSAAPLPQPPHYAPGSFDEACVAADELQPAFQATPGALDWIADARDQREKELNQLRREKRPKERAKRKKRKGR